MGANCRVPLNEELLYSLQREAGKGCVSLDDGILYFMVFLELLFLPFFRPMVFFYRRVSNNCVKYVVGDYGYLL
jgi:hypothetical protein